MTASNARYACVEGGGTTWLCAISIGAPDNIVTKESFPTEDPATTLAAVKQWLINNLPFDGLGVATFGPISHSTGCITSTPKPYWKDTDVLKFLGVYDELKGIPYRFDTDVNAPALAEYILRKDEPNAPQSCAYVTVGTGIGVGLVVNGATVKGLLHPEAGHIQVKRHPTDTFEGTCPYHKDCVEGMCSSGAITGRKNCTQSDLPLLPDEDAVWDYCAYYLAQLCVTIILVSSPEAIAIGGGLLNRACLYPLIRKYTLLLLNGYVVNDMLTPEKIDDYIKPSCWGSAAGLVGAAFLAKQAADGADSSISTST